MSVSIITLVDNHLYNIDRLLSSFFQNNTYFPIEWIIFDRGFHEKTAEIVAKHAADGFIRLINCSKINSFTKTCKYGASKAKYPYLLFVVNSFIFTRNILPLAISKISASDIGAIVFRNENFESSPTNSFLCQKADFLKLAERYENDVDFKDFDFSVSFCNLLNIKSVCINENVLQKEMEPLFDLSSSSKTVKQKKNHEDTYKYGKNLNDKTQMDNVIEPAAKSKLIFKDTAITNWHLSDKFLILKNGDLKCSQNGSFVCGVKNQIPIEPDKFYQLSFSFKTISNTAMLYCLVRDSKFTEPINYFDGNQIPVIMNHSVNNNLENFSLFFRSFCSTSSIDMYLFVKNAQTNDRLHIRDITLKRISPEQACIKPRVYEGEKIIASLASIPKRASILKDVIRSLYYQVDKICVFLNGYESIPFFLQNDSKIVVERSQIWGDNGDAGKFFWADDPVIGYRFVCDDDIIYPVDYVQTMIKKLKDYNNSVVVGLHGILLKQPLNHYYDPKARHVTHYRNENQKDYSCHVLGTGAIAYHTAALKLSHSDFQFRNMADIWLTKKTQQQNVPLVSIQRPNNWVMPQPQALEHSIYVHSVKNEGSPLNTGDVQTNIVRSLYPLTIIPETKERYKVIFAIKTYNRQDYFKECLESFLATRSLNFEWVVIIADDGSTDGTKDYLEKLLMPHEMHILKNNRRYAVGQTNTIFELCEKIGFDYGFIVDDDLFFTKPGWDYLYINAINKSGYSHLVHRHLMHAINLKRKNDPNFELASPVYDSSKTCISFGDAFFDLGTGSLFTFTPSTLKAAGYCDEKNFPIRGQWHVDYHIRSCRAGCNDLKNLYDATGSNEYIEIQNYKSFNYRCAIPWSDEYKKTKDPEELKRRYAVMLDDKRIYIPPPLQPLKKRNYTINSFFDKIYVLNLDRRPDRWKRVKRSADYFKLNLNRFPAIDGTMSPYFEQYLKYSQQKFAKVPDFLSLSNNFQFYRNYTSDMSRVAYLEKRNKSKAIGSPGAWGYLLTMIAILKDALKNEYEHILVLDDDVIFHKDFNKLFTKIIKQVPNDWLILQLGALQYHWEKKWIEWYSENLYMCKGSSIGSHAVGMHTSVIPLVLNHCLNFNMPYDEGPLHKPKAMYPDKALTLYPNLLIQDVSESDISHTTSQKKVMSMKNNTYRWNMESYMLPKRNSWFGLKHNIF